jgi:hypothetical protein
MKKAKQVINEMLQHANKRSIKDPHLLGWPKTIAFDLDGTILKYKVGMADHDAFGEPYPGVVDEMKKLRSKGWKIIIWTCRGKSKAMVSHLKKYGIPYDDINENSSGPHDSPKIHADVYVDDRAIRFDGNTKGLADKIMNLRPWHENVRT